MAEAIPYGVVSSILSKLVWLAGQELIGLTFGLNKDLEKLQETLSTINAVLRDAEEKQESNHAVKNWISRLEDAVFDAEDLLDEFDYAILQQKVCQQGQVRKFFSSSNPVAFHLKMGPRVKEIRERLDVVAADISKFNLNPRVVVMDKKADNNRESAPKVRMELIIGREKDKESIIESLLKEQNHGDSNSNIVAIVGFGGLGKTSLARVVYNDVRVANSFKRIWVCVSEEFNVCIIFKKILKSLVDDKVDDLDLDKVQRKLEENLEGKKYLVVLDDVWNEDTSKWNDFSQYLVFGAPGSKILVTARSMKVASSMGVHDPYLLKGLNEEESQNLFEKVAFEGRQIDPKLGLIGKVVAQKCKGVPLAIKCLGGLMRQKPDENYWSSVQEDEIWKLVKENDGLLPALRLSYTHLPSHLKRCFTFCSLFSKDSEIYKDELIHSWRAQGYIQLREGNENIQDIGDEYFNELLSRSFFQEEEKDDDGNIFCKMHDLIHDLALSVAGCRFHWMKDEKESIPKGIRHVSLEKNSKEVAFTLSKTKGIRTMFFRTHISNDLFIRNATFLKFNCLRMLNLSGMGIRILPNLIGELKHLRYLDLSCNFDMEVLPDAIAKLHNLQTLLLNDCQNLKELPRDIRQLISLEYLNISRCGGLNCLPKGLGELTSLQGLDRFIVNSVEDNFSIAATLNELRDLNGLGKCLRIEHLDNVRNVELESQEANLKKKKRLQSLQLYWKPFFWSSPSSPARVASEKDELLLNILEPHPNLKELKVFDFGGARFSSWLSSLTNLVELEIYNFWNCQHLPPLDHLSSLKSLSLNFSNVLKNLPPLDHLSSLEFLTLERFNVLEHVADSFPLPCSTQRTSFFPSLKKLEIKHCPNLKGWWRTRKENQGPTADLPCFPCLSELEISNSPNLTSMPLFPSLDQKLTLIDTSVRPLQQTLKLKMKMTEASVTSEASSSSSSSSLPSSSSSSPSGSPSHSYPSTSLPLSNLKGLTLKKIHDLKVLSKEFLQNLTSLAHLTLKDCPKLQSLLLQKMSCLTSLQELWIKNCPNLRALPEWILNLTSLRTLQIQKCLELQYMPEGTHRLISLQELYVVYCHNLRALPDWIPNLTSLKELCICECLELPYLQEGMHHLNSFQQLWIYNCPNPNSPDWIRNFSFPKTLLIQGCPDLHSLRVKVHRLVSLQELNIQNCLNLRDLLNCISNIASLKRLKICKCPELQDLPEGMDGLTSLQVLSISECPQLSERCEKETGILWPRIARIPSIIIDGRQIQ
ncbi:disease resistance protein RGA2-like [Herrania umbratica]|uniref:Disease resistance protein RGA2-like n=1 Tax=Herrania umbratica TaxID=108875 RepID=A0A6J1APH6_9ROSI|nr:disease resistance protein RGA2-like [Herrania umbratica]XP_021288425.1 disease resistance protein RGA2-like [Herrania umbratica]